MQALVFDGVRRIRFVEDQPLPALAAATDAVVRVSLCAVCGSDLHPFRGDEAGIMAGTGEGLRWWGRGLRAAGLRVGCVQRGRAQQQPTTM